MGPHLPDDVLGIQPGTTQTGSFQFYPNQRKSFLRCPAAAQLPGWLEVILPAGDCLPMDLFGAMCSDLAGCGTAAVSPGNLVRIFADQSCVILTIRHFEQPPRAATTLRNSLVWPKLSDGLVC